MNTAVKMALLLASAALTALPVSAERLLRLPSGMGGVPDIGAIPCHVVTGKLDPETGEVKANSGMVHVAPLGTRLSFLTWADGYLYARTGKTMEELLTDAADAGQDWDFSRLTNHLVDYCAANPDAITRDAVQDLETQLIPQQRQ